MIKCESGANKAKETVRLLEVMSQLPEKIRGVLKDVPIVVGSKRSGYDVASGTVYISKLASKRQITHEIGHAVEFKLCSKSKIDAIKKSFTQKLTLDDIVVRTYKHTDGTAENIFILQSDKFVQEYQGRLYITKLDDAVDKNGNIDIDNLGEFVSVPFEEYICKKNNLKKDQALYNMIDEVIK